MIARGRRFVVRYGIALAGTLLATGLRLPLEPSFDGRVPYVTYFPVIVVAAWYGGLGPTLLAVVCCGLAAVHFFIPPDGAFLPLDAANWMGLVLFAVFGVGTGLLSEWMRLQSSQVQQQRERFFVTLASIGDGVIVTDTEGRVTYLNPVAEQLTGWTTADAEGEALESVFCIVTESTRERAENPVSKALSEGRAVGLVNHTLLISRDGTERPIADSAAPIRDGRGNLFGVVLVFRDVTEARRSKKAAEENEKLLALRLEISASLAADQPVDATLQQCCESLEAFLEGARAGIWVYNDRAEVLEWRAGAGTPPDDAHRRIALGASPVGQIGASRTPLCTNDVAADPQLREFARSDGDDLAAFAGFPLTIGNRLLGVVALFARQPLSETLFSNLARIADGITQYLDRQRAAVQLQESEARTSSIISSALDAIITIDDRGCVIEFNRAAERMFGYARQVVLGREMAELIIPPRLRDAHRRGLALYLETGEGPVLDQHLEMEAIRADGSEFPVELAITRVGDTVPPIFTGYVHDITERKQAEERLRDSEERFRRLAEAMPQIVWIADSAGRIQYFNQRWYEYTGLESQESPSDDWIEMVHPDDRGRYLAAWGGAVSAKQFWQIDARFRQHDGEYRWFLTRAVPAVGSDGHIGSWFGTSTDIDDTKRAEQTAQFLAGASAALAELTDLPSTLQKVASYAVPGFADWCAVDVLDDSRRRERMALAHASEEKLSIIMEIEKRFPSRPDERFGVVPVLRTGEPEWAEEISDHVLTSLAQSEEHLQMLRGLEMKSYICVPIRSQGRTLGAITFVSEQPDRRYSGSDLRVAHDMANRAAVAIDNVNLYRALQDADRRKDEFLATLAHELRNPLAPIRMGLELMRLADGDPGVIEETRLTMERQTKQLITLVDDLLDVSRITRGKLELRKCEIKLSEVVQSAVEACRPFVEEAGHELNVSMPEEPIFLFADPYRLVQVFSNLLNNAIKYTPGRGRISLTVEPRGREVVVSVHDTGIGIAPGMLDRIFEMFTQVDHPVERGYPGLGIGLTLVKSLVAMHGGSIRAESGGVDQGSTFSVQLPMAASTGDRPQETDESAKAVAHCSLRVLVVDDNQSAAEMLSMVVKLFGNEVRRAIDGMEAIEVASEFHPDVILMDLGMPRMNGYDAARKIRASSWGRSIQLVAITGWGQAEDKQRTREAGFDYHLTKPAEPVELRQLLQKIGENREAPAPEPQSDA